MAGALVGSTGKVISIEANPNAYELLERNLRRNNAGTPIQCALTSRTGEVELFMPTEGDVYSSLLKGGLVQGDSVMSFKISGRSLDEVVGKLSLSRVDLVKIDIEGAEIDALSSAANCISKFRPVIIMEYGTNTWPAFGATSNDLKQISQRYGYVLRLFDPRRQTLTAIHDEFWSRPYANLILSPEGNS